MSPTRHRNEESDSQVTPEMIRRLSNPKIVFLLHGLIAMVTEIGEALSDLKQYIYDGKPLNRRMLQWLSQLPDELSAICLPSQMTAASNLS